jgi:hypothetical protein
MVEKKGREEQAGRADAEFSAASVNDGAGATDHEQPAKRIRLDPTSIDNHMRRDLGLDVPPSGRTADSCLIKLSRRIYRIWRLRARRP